MATCQNWFARFRAGNFDPQDQDRCGRFQELVTDQLQSLLDEDPRQSTRELAIKLNVDQLTILRIVTGDEKWIYFDNPVNKKQWLNPGEAPICVPKPNIHGKKVMLCVWWDMKGILYYELLEPCQTVNAKLYGEQLMRLNQKIIESRTGPGNRNKKVILLHDNARPHVALDTKETIMELGWEVLPHPAYSPDLAPSEYYLFRSLEHFLRGKSFENIQGLRNELDLFFQAKTVNFFRDGIRQLPIKCHR